MGDPCEPCRKAGGTTNPRMCLRGRLRDVVLHKTRTYGRTSLISLIDLYCASDKAYQKVLQMDLETTSLSHYAVHLMAPTSMHGLPQFRSTSGANSLPIFRTTIQFRPLNLQKQLGISRCSLPTIKRRYGPAHVPAKIQLWGVL